ncbi:ankyrin repeat-containing protein [Gnomoniopsis smithogilvyi]|uniref:Ankyrin repeat-containing protein n=1 Tax=Gnomoniopsis smithogilvyi TaxID=1191159 RepID=A0A9W9CV74_9PEZI|nr:ankyrin repeat-containing protein [Gnomoniopsis smithogilvyi]
MAPNLSEDEIDDLIYFARAGETADLTETLTALSAREGVSPAEILLAARDSGKSTCLHMATGNGNLEITTLLLSHFTSPEQKTAFLDAPNEFGNTGLHWAALGGHLSVVKFLVEQGSGLGVANDKGYIPLDLASFGEKMDVVDYFLAGMEDMEGENGEALGSAAEGLELGEADAGEEEVEAEGSTAKEAEGGKPSGST